MKKLISAIVTGLSALLLVSCETRIYPELENANAVYVVDGWLNNKPGPQTIVLSKSQSYFDNSLPPGISGAVISVRDDKGKVFSFLEESGKPGYYKWTPVGNEVFGTVDNSYQLTIQVNGETLTATSKMGRVPLIDSITFDTDKRTGTNDLITRGQFWATDPVGPGDTYWIRTYKNGTLLNKPIEINYAYDAGFSAGAQTDGVTFITPIRRGINSNDTDASGKRLNPVEVGDSLNVQLFSITHEAFNHLNEVKIQTNRPGGFQELFSTPLANVSTNIVNVNTQGTKAQGFFNVSAVSSGGKRYNK
ncbi:MAG TPA: DUF4249 domain-containing protein [Cyclobacteriaceae bacterium]|nr:DUF4249 domain-containing protein [Cyclobacteriaceae bacterium]